LTDHFEALKRVTLQRHPLRPSEANCLSSFCKLASELTQRSIDCVAFRRKMRLAMAIRT
jgi:hypothetical protein